MKRQESSKQQPDIEPEYMTVKAAAARFGVSEWSIRNDFYNGRIRTKRYGARVLIELASLKEYFASLPDGVSTRVRVGEARNG